MTSELTKLTEKQELFCNLYATNRDTFGNGTQAYIEAYNIDVKKKGAYAGARTSAYNLLTNTDILKRIDELLELGPLNDAFVDRQLAKIVEQDADFGAKMAAIKEYNALRARITKKVLVGTVDVRKEVLKKYGVEDAGEAKESESGSSKNTA